MNCVIHFWMDLVACETDHLYNFNSKCRRSSDPNNYGNNYGTQMCDIGASLSTCVDGINQ